MIKDMHNEGYEKYCLHMDRLEIMSKEYKAITIKTLQEVYNGCYNKKGDEKLNLENAITRETCNFGKTLLFVLGKSKLTVDDLARCQNNKKYLYKVFFKPEYEPLVEEIDK